MLLRYNNRIISNFGRIIDTELKVLPNLSLSLDGSPFYNVSRSGDLSNLNYSFDGSPFYAVRSTTYIPNIWINTMITDYQTRNGMLSYRQISTLKTILSPYYVFNNTVGYYYNTFGDRTDSTWLFLMFVENNYFVITEI